MATLNPLEAKARSSFWKGIIIAALFGILGCGALGYFLYSKISTENARLNAQKTIYVFKQGVISGQIIQRDMLEPLKVDASMAPAEASGYEGATKDEMVDIEGHPIYLSDIKEEADDNIYILEEDENTKVKIQYNNEEEGYVYLEGNKKGQLVTLGEGIFVSKIDIPAKTVLVPGMIRLANEQLTDDLREREYNCIVLPTDLEVDQSVDIRLRLPSGEDYIVISKKRVIATSSGDMSTNYCKFKLNHIDTLMLSAAIVDAATIDGATVYAVKYVDAGMQNEAITTYEPSTSILELIQNDPNAVTTAKNALVAEFANEARTGLKENYRMIINQKLRSIEEKEQSDAMKNSAKSQASIQNADRAAFLGGMGD